MSSRCPVCGATYPAGVQFCVREGTPLVPLSSTPGGYTPPPIPAMPPPPGTTVAPARTSSPLVVGGLAGAVVALAGAVGFLWMRQSDDRPAPVAAATTEASPEYGATRGADEQPPTTFEATPAAPGEAPNTPAQEAPTRTDPPLQYRGTAPAAPARSAASYGPARIVTDGVGLLLRDGPGQQYAAIGKMLQHDVVTVNGCTEGAPGRRWCDVVYGGVRGYASDEFLRIGEPASDSDSGHEQAFASARIINTMTYVDGSKVSYVNLREQPSVNASVVVRMRPGTSVYVRRCLPRGWSLGGRAIAGSWCFVTAEQDGRSISGWASDDALWW